MADYPTEYSYSSEHEWVSLDGDLGTVGITHHAQAELGDIVFVELPEPGSSFAQGESFGTIESVKAVSELYAPVSGEIIEINEQLIDQPEIVNDDPHQAAWLVKIKLSDPAQADALMSAEDYQKQIEE